jgi:putative transcriptional regulator
MSDAEILASAKADPDAQPLTDKQLRAMKRVAPVKQIRWKLGLSQEEFAVRFQIPLGTLRLEAACTEPDQAAQAYLRSSPPMQVSSRARSGPNSNSGPARPVG